MVLEGALCALLLAILAGACVWSAEARGQADPRRATVSTAPPPQSVSADLAGRHERLVGVHEPSLQGQLELPRPTRKPSPSPPRFTPRQALAPRPQAWTAVRIESHRGWRTPEEHGRIADRPIVANCPAQGPPRTA